MDGWFGNWRCDSEAKNIDDCNILVCTSEKLDSLLRHRSELVSDVCCVVADEFHLMNDGTRGPTLEINLTRLRHIKPDAQIIALSATVGNSPDLAAWLDANLIQSDWRPVALEYATFHDFHVEPRKVQSPGDETEHNTLSPPATSRASRATRCGALSTMASRRAHRC